MSQFEKARSQFPALTREFDGYDVCYFDGPAGSQIPESVISAVSNYMAHNNSNCGAPSITGQETDFILAQAREAMADFVNASDANEIVFGANMTTQTFALSRTISREWSADDEIIVTRLDHDANVTPWVLAAEAVGAMVHHVNINPDDCTLDLEHYQSLLNERTKLVAVGLAANATGTVNPVQEMTAQAKAVGAMVFVDAVHFAPHALIDVAELGCDFLACSAYKFFGPHVGILWGKRELLEQFSPDKLRPAPNGVPGKWMTGTQNHEGIAGVWAAVRYLADLSDPDSNESLRESLANSFAMIETYEDHLEKQFLSGIADRPAFKLWGVSSLDRLKERVPTFSITHERLSTKYLCEELAKVGIFTWAGNHYALPFTEAMGLEPDGTLRIGLLHYNTKSQVDRLFEELDRIVST